MTASVLALAAPDMLTMPDAASVEFSHCSLSVSVFRSSPKRLCFFGRNLPALSVSYFVCLCKYISKRVCTTFCYRDVFFVFFFRRCRMRLGLALNGEKMEKKIPPPTGVSRERGEFRLVFGFRYCYLVAVSNLLGVG